MNRTDDESTGEVIAWIVFPIVLGTLLYMALALFVWPYARPIFPLWILLLCIFFPPFFPFLLFYMLIFVAFSASAYRRPVVVWVPPSQRGVVRTATARPAMTVRSAGNRV